MKKLIVISMFILAFNSGFSQTDTANNELKMNLSNLIGFKWLDASYERILNEESSIGFGTLVSLDNSNDGLDEFRNFSLTPYYRHFFSDRYAQGFFVEAFTMIHSGKNDYYYDDFGNSTGYNEDKYTDLAVGVSVGAKWVSRRGFVTEIYGGIGRDMFGNNDTEVVSRGGISVGYRFK